MRSDEACASAAFEWLWMRPHPGEADYSPLVSKMQAAGVDVFFLGGYLPETGLIFRQAHDRGYDVQLIASSAVATADLPLIAGPALEGSLMIATADMRTRPEAAEVVARFRAQGYEPGKHALRLRRGSGVGPGGGGSRLAGP